MNTEKKLVLGIAAASFLVSGPLYLSDAPPIVLTVSLTLMLTCILHALLGGTQGSEVKYRGVKLTGSVATLAVLGYFINGQLEKYNPPISPISPNPDSWIAVDSNGAFIPVTIGKDTYSKNVTEFLSGAEWEIEMDSMSIWATQGNHYLAQLDPMTIRQVGLFNLIEMSPEKGMQYTEQMTIGVEASLMPYPFSVRTTQFRDEYNEFQILNENGEIILDRGLLRTKNFRVFEYDGQYYLFFVVRANHIDPNSGPWVVFGITQIVLELSVVQ